MEHTAIPWQLHAPHSIRVCKANKDGSCRTVVEAEILGREREEAEADAQFVERAVNNYAKLLAALELSAGRLHSLTDDPECAGDIFRDCPNSYCAQARDAIQEAKK